MYAAEIVCQSGPQVLAVVDVVALDQGQDGADDGLVELILHILQSSVRFDDLVVACALRPLALLALRLKASEFSFRVLELEAVPV